MNNLNIVVAMLKKSNPKAEVKLILVDGERSILIQEDDAWHVGTSIESFKGWV